MAESAHGIFDGNAASPLSTPLFDGNGCNPLSSPLFRSLTYSMSCREVNTSWQQTMGSGCCEAVKEFESVWVHACVSGVITRRQFCVLLYGCSSCWESFARKAHSETLTCISRYIYPFANALLGKFSRIDLHTLACPRNVHRNP